MTNHGTKSLLVVTVASGGGSSYLPPPLFSEATMGLSRNEILKSGEYVGIPKCVLSSTVLGASDKLVYAALLDHLGKNVEAWPSQALVAHETGLSLRCVRYAIERLLSIKVISCDSAVGTSNRYRFTDLDGILNHQEGAATLAQPSKCEGGNACSITPAKVAEGTATVAVYPGNACSITPAKAAPELLKKTTSLTTSRTTSVEPHHSATCGGPQPAAAVSVSSHQSLEQGDGQVKKSELNARFKSLVEEIYQAYPRKVGKAAATKAIISAAKRTKKLDLGKGVLVMQFLLDRTKLYAASPAGKQGKFTPHPSTWFNQDRFLDDEQEWELKTSIRGDGILRVISEDNDPIEVTMPEEMTPEERERDAKITARYAAVGITW